MTVDTPPEIPPLPQESKQAFPIWLSAVLFITFVLIASIGYIKSFWHASAAAVDTVDEPQDVGASEERRLAPALQALSEKGQLTRLKDFKGKVVLLSFWASWCGPCLEELPAFAELSKKYHALGLEVLAVNVDESIDEAKIFIAEFWKNKAIPFASFFDQAGAASRAFNVEVLPTNFLIDRSGRIAFSGYGASDWSSDEVKESIDDLLKEPLK